MNEERLILDNIPLIYKVIKDMHCYWRTDDEWQDLYDAGLEGLIRGAKYYNSGISEKSTYLYRCIKNQICRHIYLANMDKRKSEKHTLSLNKLFDESGELEYIDIVIDESADVEKEAENRLKLDSILYQIDKLSNRTDALFIKMYYGLGRYKEHNIREIADKFGVSKSLVNMRIRRGIARIASKKNLEHEYLKYEKEFRNTTDDGDLLLKLFKD